MAQAILWYFADPMCSWCWGFSPVIHQIKQNYHDKIQIALNLGGLRPGTSTAISSNDRDEVLHHWHEVNKLTGQEFTFEKALPDGFIYDTEPASRAIIAFGKLDKFNTLAYFHDIQQAFYRGLRDVTQQHVLIELALNYNIQKDEFSSLFLSDDTRQQTQQHFTNSRQATVIGFPSLVFQYNSKHQFLTRGYANYHQIQQQLDDLLDEPDS